MLASGTSTYDRPVVSLQAELAVAKCDRCNAEARVLLTHAAGRLTLCRHHWLMHEEQLTKDGWSVSASTLDRLTA